MNIVAVSQSDASRVTDSPTVVAKAVSDEATVASILEGLLPIKGVSEQGHANTGIPFNVHPGLVQNVVGLTSEIIQFLSANLHSKRFNSAAIMGLNNGGPEPWVFVPLIRRPTITGTFSARPSPGLGPITSLKMAQMLSFIDSDNVPPASSTNLSPINNNLVTGACQP